jgi:hypothetical protein
VSKCNCSSQKLLPITGIRTRVLWFCSLDLRPLDQLAVKYRFVVSISPSLTTSSFLIAAPCTTRKPRSTSNSSLPCCQLQFLISSSIVPIRSRFDGYMLSSSLACSCKKIICLHTHTKYIAQIKYL